MDDRWTIASRSRSSRCLNTDVVRRRNRRKSSIVAPYLRPPRATAAAKARQGLSGCECGSGRSDARRHLHARATALRGRSHPLRAWIAPTRSLARAPSAPTTHASASGRFTNSVARRQHPPHRHHGARTQPRAVQGKEPEENEGRRLEGQHRGPHSSAARRAVRPRPVAFVPSAASPETNILPLRPRRSLSFDWPDACIPYPHAPHPVTPPRWRPRRRRRTRRRRR